MEKYPANPEQIIALYNVLDKRFERSGGNPAVVVRMYLEFVSKWSLTKAQDKELRNFVTSYVRMAKSKSFDDISEQVKRIQSCFYEYKTNAEFCGSWLEKAYKLTDKCMYNIACHFLYSNNNSYPDGWTKKKVNISVYAHS